MFHCHQVCVPSESFTSHGVFSPYSQEKPIPFEVKGLVCEIDRKLHLGDHEIGNINTDNLQGPQWSIFLECSPLVSAHKMWWRRPGCPVPSFPGKMTVKGTQQFPRTFWFLGNTECPICTFSWDWGGEQRKSWVLQSPWDTAANFA